MSPAKVNMWVVASTDLHSKELSFLFFFREGTDYNPNVPKKSLETDDSMMPEMEYIINHQ